MKVWPLATGAVNMNAPFAVTARLFPPLFCSIRPLPTKPLTVPATVYVLVTQATATVVTFWAIAVMVPPVTVQVCEGEVGCWETVTVAFDPAARLVAKVKAPLVLTVS